MPSERLEHTGNEDRPGQTTRPLDPAALMVEDAARMLDIPREWVQEDLEAGAPRNPDGTVNLIHYAAWLNKALQEEANSGEPA